MRSWSGLVAHGVGRLPSGEAPSGAGAIDLTADILPTRIPRIARLRGLVDEMKLAYGRHTSKSHARLGVQGGRATQRQNHESTVAVPLWPGARVRSVGGTRSRGGRVPVEGVLLLITLLARWRPDDEDSKLLLLLVDGTTDARQQTP